LAFIWPWVVLAFWWGLQLYLFTWAAALGVVPHNPTGLQ
jgi:hypothetical protein